MSEALTREQVNAMAMNARNGYRISNPGSCDSNRHAACVDVQVLAASYESLRARLEAQTERAEKAERSLKFQDDAYIKDHGHWGECLWKQQVADLTAKMEDVTQGNEKRREMLEKQAKSLNAFMQLYSTSQQQLAAMTQERDELKERRKVEPVYGSFAHIDELEQQLAASEQRVKVLEDGYANQTAVVTRREAGFQASIDQLQATVTAQREEIERLRASIEKLITFKNMWERAYRDECRWQNQPEGSDRQALASGKETK